MTIWELLPYCKSYLVDVEADGYLGLIVMLLLYEANDDGARRLVVSIINVR